MNSKCTMKIPLVVLPFIALLSTGCSSKMVKVSGTVTHNNAALTNVKVVFTPVDGGKGQPAVALVDDKGEFTMTTTNPGDGVMRGDYKVTVIQVNEEEIDSEEKAAKMNDPNMDPAKRLAERQKLIDKQRKRPAEQKLRFHINYTKVATTPLKITVPPEGKVTFNLNDQGT